MHRAKPATESDLIALLAELGIAQATHRHPPLFTVAESRALRGALPGGHCKCLFLKDKKTRYLLAVVLEDRRADLKALAAATGFGRLSFGSAQRMMDVLGVTPGAVTPFALINRLATAAPPPLGVVLDAEMLKCDPLNYHPLHNEATTAISPDGLLRFVRHCGIEPQILDFDKI
ncbi:MAG: prolyl-tRNA synthetase associated domain-containing protein [Sphingomonadales bacterium]|nr:prolyl-tRNA synthetase associated domain-containing protein [Sphingomonadales bacterium]